MAGLHFDSSFNSEPVTKALEKIQKGVYETAKAAELSGGRIDAAFNRISLKGIERIYELMQGFPKEVQGIESFKKQMADLEKRLEQANKKILELQNQAKQPITVRTNTSEVTKETSAYDSLLESLNDILGARGQNISAILQEQNAIRINQKELKVLQEIEDKGLKLSDAQQTRRIQLTNSIMQHKQAISSLQQVVSNEIKLEESAKGSMDEMSQSLGRMRMAYRQLTEQERNSKFGQDLLKNIQGADLQIKQLDETLGIHTRKVGDYKSQWNRLNMSIQQVAREMPSLANGPKTFFSAISNNLPILADEIKRAKDEFNALKAEGKDATPVWKQVASSLFSWNTALTIGITLLTLYGDKLVDLVGGLFNAKDATKELLSAEQEMALARKKAILDSANERTELDLLYNKLKSTTISTEERNAAVSEWMKKYPQHSNIMNGELVSLGKLDLAYRSLSKQIIESAKARVYLDKITELESKKNNALTKRQNQYVTYQKAIAEREKAVAEYDKKITEGFGSVTSKHDAENRIKITGENIEEQKKAWVDLIELTSSYDKSIQIMSKNIKLDNLFPQAIKGTYDYWQQQVQIADSALKQIDSKQKELMDAGKFDGIDSNIVANYKTQSKLLKEAQKELKVYDTTGKYDKQQESAVEKLRKQQEKYKLLMDKQSREQIRSSEDLWNEVWQAQIDTMDEGGKKTLAQMELNHEKELQAIDRQREDLLRKKKEQAEAVFNERENDKKTRNPNYVKQTFDGSGVTLDETENNQFDGKYKATLDKQAKDRQAYYAAEKQAMNEYLADYGDYMQKRQAIIDQGEEKKKGKSQWEQKSVDEDTKKLLAGVDDEVQKKTSIITQLFSDMSKRTVADMRLIADQAQKTLDYVNAGEFKTDDSGKGLFGLTKEQFDILSKSPEKLESIKNEIVSVRTEADASETALNKLGNGLKKVFSSGSDTKKFQEGLADISEGMNSVLQAGQFLSDSLSTLGDAFGNDTLSGIADGINVAMDAMSSTMNGAKAGAAFGPWGAAAGAAIGMVTSLASSFAKIHDTKNEKRITVLQDQIGVLEKSYDKLGNSIEKAYSKDASKLIDQQNTLLEQQKILIRNQIAEERDKKKTDDGRIEEWERQIEDINKLIEDNKENQIDAIFGEDLKSAINNFAQAYTDAWTSGEDKAKSAKETVKNMMRQMVTESIKAAIQSSESMERIRAKLQEFYSDNVLSGWEQDYIYNMADSLQKELDNKFGWADGLIKDEKESTSQDSTSGGFETMSQDTGEELNGRFTALQISNEEIKNSMLSMLSSMNLISVSTGNNGITLMEIRNIALMSNSHLEDISKHTKTLLEVGGKLDRIESNTKGLTSR